MTLAFFAIPIEGSKELGGLPSTQSLQQVCNIFILPDKYEKSAASPQTQNFHVEQKILFAWWPLQSSSYQQVLQIPVSTPCFLSHYWSVTWCLDLVALHAQAHQSALEAAWVSQFHSPDCFPSSVLFQHLSTSVLHFHCTPIYRRGWRREKPFTGRFSL